MTPTTKHSSWILYLGPLSQKFTPQNLHKIAYNSACTTDRPEMFGPTRGFSGMADSMEPCKMLWGRLLLPWQRKFRLGAEIQTPTGLLSYFLRHRQKCWNVWMWKVAILLLLLLLPWLFDDGLIYATVLGNAWTDFHETFTKRQRGKLSFQRRTQMGARPQIIFLGLKTDIVRTGAAWRFFAGLKTDKSYLLVPPPGEWLRISLEPGYFYGGCVKKAWTSECI